MTDRAALHDYGNSRAVLIGTSSYRHLNPVQAAAHSLRRMQQLLTSELCGWPGSQITVIEDAPGPGDLHSRLIELFHNVEDVALLYFVGHGFVDDEDQLCLGLVGSSAEPHLRASTSLEFRDVRDAMIRSSAQTSILILDCCFSGQAGRRGNTLAASADLADQAGGAGAYTMAACQAYGTASFETDRAEPQTYFTKYLVDLIRAGIPGEPGELRLRPIFRRLSQALTADGHPRPIERNIDSASEFIFAHNAAPVQVQADVPTALRQLNERIARMEGLAERAGAPAEPPSDVPARAADQLPGGGAGASIRVSPRPGADQAQRIAGLRAKAAGLLRVRKTDEFRVVEAQLQQLGASARPTAVLQTSMGDITIQLYPDFAPEAVRNFIELAEGTRSWIDPRQLEPLRRTARLYDGTLFHRVVRGRLIQGGDPIGTGTGGPGYRQANEFHRELSFGYPYMMAMANAGSSSNGSQFFITVSPAPWLTHKHTIFGAVINGSGVAERISQVPVGAGERPIDDVVLEAVRISGDLTSHG
jgi:cyclophilin family peptidyl-prolyl cis-trans isomerase